MYISSEREVNEFLVDSIASGVLPDYIYLFNEPVTPVKRPVARAHAEMAERFPKYKAPGPAARALLISSSENR